MDSQEVDDKGDIRNVPKHIIKELISTYKCHPALWQIKNKDLYGNRTLKYKGHQALVNIWKKYDEDADIKMVKNKIQSLRGSFRKELKKVSALCNLMYLMTFFTKYFEGLRLTTTSPDDTSI